MDAGAIAYDERALVPCDHLAVLLHSHGQSLADAKRVLDARRG